ncbi:hypothetical protein ACJJTC_004953 [Scirpophaga incertulas]
MSQNCSMILNENKNVTIRRQQLFRTKSYESIHSSSFDSTHSELHMRSFDLSTRHDGDMIEILKSENANLKEMLSIANNEVDNLNLQIIELKRCISQQSQKIESLKSICTSPSQKHISNLRRKSRINSDTTSNLLSPKPSISKTIVNYDKKEENVTLQGNKNLNNERMQHKSYESSTEIPELSRKAENNLKTIYIYGGEQCRGLANRLIKTRLHNKYEKYRITSVIKPDASSKEILKNINELTFKNHNNRIILSIGEHDTNPSQIATETTAVLKILRSYQIFVLGIRKNKFLNINKLNELLKRICAQFDNCTFLDIYRGDANYHNGTITQKCCKLINLAIDSHDYNTKYLIGRNSSDTLAHTSWIKSLSKPKMPTKPKKGTIPFYFQSTNTKTINGVAGHGTVVLVRIVVGQDRPVVVPAAGADSAARRGACDAAPLSVGRRGLTAAGLVRIVVGQDRPVVVPAAGAVVQRVEVRAMQRLERGAPRVDDGRSSENSRWSGPTCGRSRRWGGSAARRGACDAAP